MAGDTVEDREVSWQVLDIPVYGTITAPAEGKTRSPVVFVAGSGPTDRNWCSPLLPGTNGSAKLLAEALAGRGYLTLRYDKIASGPHVRENVPKFSGKLSMQTHVDELAGAVKTVLSERNVDPHNLFVLTNSEGAIHAVNYQLQATTNRFKGLVLTGAPGRAIGELGRSQILNQVKSLPEGEAIMKHYDEAVAQFLSSKPVVIDDSLPRTIKLLLRGLENPTNLPFARELWTFSLPEHVARVSEPTLIMIGKKDIQIDWKVDGKALEDAASANSSLSFAYPDYANHVLKHEEAPFEKLTPQYISSHYNAPDAKLDEEAANTIFSWLGSAVK